ncbi:MAG: ABC transporter permease, partial [Dehalococcoidales bacterium]
INMDDFQAIGSLNGVMTKLKQEGTEQEYTDFFIQGADSSYTETITYEFDLMAAGYNNSQEVWQALKEESGTAVVSPYLVPTKAGMDFEESTIDFQLEGFYIEDEIIPETYIQIQNQLTGEEKRLRVIGVLNQEAFYASGIITSQDTVNSLFSQPVLPLFYMFQLKDGVDAEAVAKELEVSFVQHGMQTTVMAEEIREGASVSQMMNILFQGFMGLGLLVGIAALGVITARSVVERRKQIGVLRALGFQKSMVQFSFLIESSFIALLGIGLGVVLGAGLSIQIIDSMKESFANITYEVPWVNIIIVVIIAYGASLLTTYLPARQAAKIYPAEALRFE